MSKANNSKNTSGNPKKGLGIKGKLIIFILPLVLAALVAVTFVCTYMAYKSQIEQTTATMNASLEANNNMVDSELENIRKAAIDLSIFVSKTYKDASMETYKAVFSDMINQNDLIIGSGIWFEPKVYSGESRYSNQEYVGPYWYKDGDDIVEDWQYSNADYDYFSQEYYTDAKAMTELKASITDPYFDPASSVVMASCSAPIFNEGGNYIGCITVDMSLDTIAAVISEIKVGNSGVAVLTTADGTYIYTQDAEKVQNAVKITEDSSPISAVGEAVLSNESGEAVFNSGSDGKTNVYYSMVPEVGWKLLLLMPQSEIFHPIYIMMNTAIIILAVAAVVCVIVIMTIASGIAKPIKKVQKFAQELAAGNFTIDKIDIRRSDEIGQMSDSLNVMYENNSGVIRNISKGSNQVNESSDRLSDVAMNLLDNFANVHTSMREVNDAMTSTGAATEQVSASTNEVNDSVQKLTDETNEIRKEVGAILKRAESIERDSQEACDNAIEIARIRGEELEAASKKAVVIEEIGTLANSIAEIASEINLLSLNASIEAARAGEHGRGFAVVADEINNLASQTASAVEQIQGTVAKIQEAFKQLDNSAGGLLAFVKETVTPDYEKFIEIGQQYGSDAKAFGDLTEQTGEMVRSISVAMDQVNAAVSSIAESANVTAGSAAEVTDTVENVNEMVEDISQMAESQQDVSSNLNEIVNAFKLDITPLEGAQSTDEDSVSES